jgi:hypothetical protein
MKIRNLTKLNERVNINIFDLILVTENKSLMFQVFILFTSTCIFIAQDPTVDLIKKLSPNGALAVVVPKVPITGDLADVDIALLKAGTKLEKKISISNCITYDSLSIRLQT